MRTRFQQQMEELREKLLRMGGLAELAVDRACQGYTERDLHRCQLTRQRRHKRMPHPSPGSVP